ncbi:hypothetical protein SCA6_010230 [Theobroma cacao]
MLRTGIKVTPFTISDVLVGCSLLEKEELGAQVHCFCLKVGFFYNVVIGTGLLDMYSKCWNIENSRRVFDKMIDKNVITWTAMVSGCAQNGLPNEAMALVKEMLGLGLRLNHVTYNSLLSSFLSPDYLDCCRQVHCRIIQDGLESNVYIAVTLLTVYSKCSCSLEDFQKLCEGVSWWDQVSWNAVIAGFCNLSYDDKAMKCFVEMRQAGINMDFFTFTSMLGAIGNSSALEGGKQMHALILKTGNALNPYVQNGLVSMYARCGVINDSKMVFSLMEEHDVISWNSLLSGCAHHGYGREALELFEQMRKTEITPDSTTFLAVLSACSHVGFLDKGLEYFELMKNDALLELPGVEHYAAVINLFGRAAYLNEAEAFINSMPIEPGPSVYKALLSACEVYGNIEIATRSANRLLELWPNDPATYVLLSKVLKMGNDWDDAAECAWNCIIISASGSTICLQRLLSNSSPIGQEAKEEVES